MHVPFESAIICWRIYPTKFNANIKMLVHCNIFCKGEKSCMLTNTWDSPQKKWAGPVCIDIQRISRHFAQWKSKLQNSRYNKNILLSRNLCMCVCVTAQKTVLKINSKQNLPFREQSVGWVSTKRSIVLNRDFYYLFHTHLH